MKKLTAYYLLFILLTALASQTDAQTPQNTSQSLDKRDRWTASDLIQPKDLAAVLANKKARQPLLLNIGVMENITAANKIGPVSKKDNLDKLRDKLTSLPKKSFVVIYCGCCPFDKCPNIRPAFNMMKDMGFSNGKLLNLPMNLQQDWISKGYPVVSAQEI